MTTFQFLSSNCNAHDHCSAITGVTAYTCVWTACMQAELTTVAKVQRALFLMQHGPLLFWQRQQKTALMKLFTAENYLCDIQSFYNICKLPILATNVSELSPHWHLSRFVLNLLQADVIIYKQMQQEPVQASLTCLTYYTCERKRLT